jgi:hypothetical protein
MAINFTGGEKASMAILIARMAKRGLAGDEVDISDLQRKAERIEKRAEARSNREAQALEKRLSEARNAAANAKVTMRTSSGKERAAARQQMHQHEQAARRIERELRRYQ